MIGLTLFTLRPAADIYAAEEAAYWPSSSSICGARCSYSESALVSARIRHLCAFSGLVARPPCNSRS